jgi:cyclic pyranopterin phosphate synthase
MKKLSHLGDDGSARMVDISGKPPTMRSATAEAVVRMRPETLAIVLDGAVPKGDVMSVARIAGIMAAKRTSDIIPLCHPLAISSVAIVCEPDEQNSIIRVVASVKVNGPTGVEMEALTAASVAALTIYDMLKAVEKGISIECIKLISKEGGKSGLFLAENSDSIGATTRYATVRRTGATPSKARRPQALKAGDTSVETKTRKSVSDNAAKRDALRRFMQSRGLTAHAWARDANLPVGVLYSFLHGRTHALTKAEELKLSNAVHVSPDDLYPG